MSFEATERPLKPSADLASGGWVGARISRGRGSGGRLKARKPDVRCTSEPNTRLIPVNKSNDRSSRWLRSGVIESLSRAIADASGPAEPDALAVPHAVITGERLLSS